jgi:aspartyl-tRNA synthetase
VMLFTNSHAIREVILFPLLRHGGEADAAAAAAAQGGPPTKPLDERSQ